MNVEGRATMEVPWLKERELSPNTHLPFHFTSAPGHPGRHYSALLPLIHEDVQAGEIQVQVDTCKPLVTILGALAKDNYLLPTGWSTASHMASLGPWMSYEGKPSGQPWSASKREMKLLLGSLCHGSTASIINTVMVQ